MNFTGIPLFSAMKAKLGYISERQSVLAQNVANADTPNYRAKDIKEPDFKTLIARQQSGASLKMHMRVTDAKHLTGNKNAGAMFTVENRPTTYELNPNGNNVVIEEEMMRIAGNQAEYQKVLGVYKKTVDMFKTAIGRPGGA